MKIKKNDAIKIAEYLKNGGYIGNGKVYSIVFTFENGMFKKVGEDRREGDKFESEYSEEGFIVEIQNYDSEEFVGLSKII
jgi:hypothetical protein